MLSKKIFALLAIVFLTTACNCATKLAGQETTKEVAKKSEAQNTIYFDVNSYELNRSVKNNLDNQADWLKNNEAARVSIEGHCDQRGSDKYNFALGKKRATAAKNYLVDQGVKASRIKVVSYGKTRPIDRENNEEAWAKNRRVIVVK
jgi:peptidoglycan-associated lipoprotein